MVYLLTLQSLDMENLMQKPRAKQSAATERATDFVHVHAYVHMCSDCHFDITLLALSFLQTVPSFA